MNVEVVNHIHKSFEKLSKHHGVGLLNEINEDGYYMVEYGSTDFVIEIEKYYRELYVVVYKTDRDKDGVNLFNLMDYLKQEYVESNFFREETNLDEAYRKQINHITTVLFENYSVIENYFKSDNYKLNIKAFKKYWQEKHPEFYKKS